MTPRQFTNCGKVPDSKWLQVLEFRDLKPETQSLTGFSVLTGTPMNRPIPYLLLSALAVFTHVQAFNQCTGSTHWNGGTPPNGTLNASGFIFGTIGVNLRSAGSFASGRPGYGVNTGSFGGSSYESLLIFRGSSFASGTYTSFKLTSPLDSNYIHIRVSDIRGDGFNAEHQRVEGYLNGVPVTATFKEPVNGAFVSGGNIINGAGTTTAPVQSAMRAFFNGPVDSIVVKATSWSDYVVVELMAKCGILLPYQLSAFSAIAEDDVIKLRWKLSAHESISKFIVEKSENGRNWDSIGEVEITASGRDDDTYSFTDTHPIPGRNFYRLRSVGINETEPISRIVSVLFKGQSHIASILLYPNPVKDKLVIQHNGNNPVQVQFLSILGNCMHQQTLAPGRSVINTADWPKGPCITRFMDNAGNIHTKKIWLQ